MALPGSKIFLLVEPPTAYVRLVGRAAVEGARDFKALVRRLDHEGIRQFCIDLSDCRLMDSTFSGVLGALASDLGPSTESQGPRFTLVNPNERVADLLDNLGVLPLVNVLKKENQQRLSTDAVPVSDGMASKEEVAICCRDAHRFLMALKPENQSKFAELTRVLDQQLAMAR